MALYEFHFKPLSYFTFPVESYTVFGAFCWGYKQFFGEKALLDLLERFKTEPPFLISSPILKLNGKLFLACPQIKDDFPEIETLENYQKIKNIKKKLKYIPVDLLVEFLEGKINSKWELAQRLNSGKEKEGEFPEIKRVVNLHNTINRITGSVLGEGLYNVPSYFYPDFSILIYFVDETLLEKVKTVFKFISFGGNKSIGYGRVSLQNVNHLKDLEKYVMFPKENPKKIYLLSPTFPDEDFNYTKSYYEVKVFCGKMDNFYERLAKPILKKKVLYLQPGSVLELKSNASKKFYGGIIPVLDTFSLVAKEKKVKIYQYGYAFPLFIKS